MAQLPLDLAFPPRFGTEDFLVAPSNAAAFAALQRWPDWPDPVLLLVGPEGSGKSHLASIWAERAAARCYEGAALANVDPLEIAATPALIEAADDLGNAEAALFHILNLAREQKASLLLTAKTPPDRWGVATADLLSRLRLAPVIRIEAPDDTLVRAVLVKLFADRQIVVDRTVVDYLALHLERSIGAARRLVDRLDRASLAAGRRITRSVAAEVLAHPSTATDEDVPSRRSDGRRESRSDLFAPSDHDDPDGDGHGHAA